MKFSGTNLYQWKPFVRLTLKASSLSKNLVEDPVDEKNPGFGAWEAEEADTSPTYLIVEWRGWKKEVDIISKQERESETRRSKTGHN